MDASVALAIERLGAPELPAFVTLLDEAMLPSADVAGGPGLFFRFRDGNGAAIGYAGMEIYGDVALLRSVLVSAALRRRGLGRAIVALMLKEAAARGVRRMFLLTSTAPAFFAAQGFETVERGTVPPEIAATREFSTFCPTEVCMTRAVGSR